MGTDDRTDRQEGDAGAAAPPSRKVAGDAATGSGDVLAACVDTQPMGESEIEHAAARVAWLPGDQEDGEVPAPGAVIDRYVVRELLGRGGMGVVLSAYDPQLDRRVAIKLLLPGRTASRDGSEPSDGRERQWLLREARAMARLSHPNVVAVHEVGTVDGRIYLAMEQIDGHNLTEWLAAEPRGWREIVRVFVAAGRGLAAAHAAGLVHRDFKPGNILISKDGRVRVTDFGLVRTVGQREPAMEGDRPAEHAELDGLLTRTGTVVGTPLFMAPEQHDGAAVDARADQFGFCAALHLALFGEPPFPAASYAELVDKVKEGVVTEPERAGEVPPRVRELLLRGLRPDPDQRYPSLEPLLAALARELSPRRRWLWLGAAVAAAGLALVAWSWWRGPNVRQCQGGAEELAGVWDPEVAAAVEARFVESGRSYAQATYQHVARGLDEYAAAWIAMRQEVCVATRVRHTQSDQMFDLRMRCLHNRRAELAALTALFAERPDPEVVDSAASAVAQLGTLADCADEKALTAAAPLPADPELRRRVTEGRERMARAQALRRAGKYRDGLTLARELVDELGDAYPPLQAEATLLVGQLERRVGDPAASETALRQAIAVAAEAHADAVAAEAWSLLIQVIGVDAGRSADALALRDSAEVALARAGTPEVLQADLLKNLGNVLTWSGDPAAAIELHKRAVAIIRRIDVGKKNIASFANDLAAAYFRHGDHQKARELFVEALAADRAILGQRHPFVGTSLYNLSLVDVRLGRLDDARSEVEQALSIYREGLGESHPMTLNAHRALSRVLAARGDFAAARESLEQVLANLPDDQKDSAAELGLRFQLAELRDRGGELEPALVAYRDVVERYRASGDRVAAAQTRSRVAGVLVRLGRQKEALDEMKASYASMKQLLDADDPRLGYALADMAEMLRSSGQCGEAVKLYQGAVSLWEEKYGRDSSTLAYPLTGLGLCRLDLGQPRGAVAALERALALASAEGAEPTDLARARFSLARALHAAGSDRDRARSLAEQARDDFARAGAGAAADRERVEQFLADLPGAAQ